MSLWKVGAGFPDSTACSFGSSRPFCVRSFLAGARERGGRRCGKAATLGRKAMVHAVLSAAGWELHGNHSMGNPQNILCAFGCRLPKHFP